MINMVIVKCRKPLIVLRLLSVSVPLYLFFNPHRTVFALYSKNNHCEYFGRDGEGGKSTEKGNESMFVRTVTQLPASPPHVCAAPSVCYHATSMESLWTYLDRHY